VNRRVEVDSAVGVGVEQVVVDGHAVCVLDVDTLLVVVASVVANNHVHARVVPDRYSLPGVDRARRLVGIRQVPLDHSS